MKIKRYCYANIRLLPDDTLGALIKNALIKLAKQTKLLYLGFI